MGYDRSWTIRYTLINVTYFIAFCTIHAMAAVFLLDNGFSNTLVGVLLALANILSAIAQPVVAGIIDRPGPLTNRRFILIAVTVILAGSLILFTVPGNRPVIFVIYALIYMVQFVYQPVMTALFFEYEKAGCRIYYGLARGLGSAGFAVTSAIVGGAVARYGVRILLIINVISMLLSAAVVYTFRKPEGEGGPDGIGDGSAETASPNSRPSFARAYPAFMVFLAGTVCFFFAHNMINDFMIQIIRSLGGGETELGYSNFLQAILELPVMAVIGLVLKRIKADRLLILSGAAFFVKILILIFAGNMAMMYLSQSMQLFAYAVFIPASAYYVNSHMSDADQVKGQAFVTSAITVGGVFSNLLSGVILDHAGITAMLVTGTAVCGAGVLIAVYALERMPARNKQ